jgi:DNA polymerase IV
VGRDLLGREIDGTMFRLIGIGLSGLCEGNGADFADLIDRRSAGAEQAMDRLRERFGQEAVVKGLALESDEDE